MNKLLAAAAIVLCSSSIQAQESGNDYRPIISTYSLGIGRETAASTYLSPLRYSGPHLDLSGRWAKRLPTSPEHLSMHFDASIGGATLGHKYSSARMYDAGLSFDWSLLYAWRPDPALTLGAGGGVGLTGGALYKPSNGNNPVAAYADLHISLEARAAWSGRIGRVPLIVSDAVRLPSLSMFFSPEYAEPYYAIYLGYRKGLINAGWWGNHFSIDNILNARLVLGSRALDLGYRLNADTSWTHLINTRRITHSFVIGVTIGAPKTKLATESTL